MVETCFPIGDRNLMADLVGAPDLRKSLGGDIEIDFGLTIPLIKYSSPFGQFKVRYACELNCASFDALGTAECRWRNELTDCCENGGDELDWVRVKNGWGLEEGITIFGTEQRANRYSILAGAQEKRPPTDAALLISDPIQCQEGDARLSFRYWTSPHTVIKVCTRPPGMGRAYDWCSKEISKGDPGPANVTIPGSVMQDFELVIEASHFDYDAFGFQGGVVILDDIEYTASAIYNCRNIPHIEPLEPLPHKTCELLECEFDELDRCFLRLRRSGWHHSDRAIGNLQTGIRNLYSGPFVYVKGRGRRVLNLGGFEVPRQLLLEFCSYIASQDAHLTIEAQIRGFEKQTLVEIAEDVKLYHKWDCRRIVLQPGNYTEFSFVVEHLPNDLAYVGLDGIHLYETDQKTRPCFDSGFVTETPAVVTEKEAVTESGFEEITASDLKETESQIGKQGLLGFNEAFNLETTTEVSPTGIVFEGEVNTKEFAELNLQELLEPEETKDQGEHYQSVGKIMWICRALESPVVVLRRLARDWRFGVRLHPFFDEAKHFAATTAVIFPTDRYSGFVTRPRLRYSRLEICG
ncbi:unnamed protein product [Bursaphelenchus xylophilus]|uniref:(pine wood nematode) hypothetical protein n=1 Tax=Bursaphelenchus xylophilus TaxID=6326 RepID=A0A1I7SRT0_BURXY|nr:unnamed protein product [Bursaphelenchus xylophilus]CAG9101883.1 unnamed protein product [Bursaphelenchus xylophilus]